MFSFNLINLNEYSLADIWNILSVIIGIYGVLVIYLPNLLPNLLSVVYLYGKSAQPFLERKSFITSIFTLPKSCFKHFYIVACTFHTALAWALYEIYFKKNNCPRLVLLILNQFSNNESANFKVVPEDVVVALFLMLLQVYRRFIECHFICVYSDARMSFLHYFFGLFFYIGVGLSLILEAPGFQENGIPIKFTGAWLTPAHSLGTALFLYGWYIQLESHLVLADLRKIKGNVMKNVYSVPEGGMFDLVSCPHYFGEVTMYFGICLVYGWRNYTFTSAFLTVLVNQIMAALMSHKWYLKTFKNYPSKRKAIIPYVF